MELIKLAQKEFDEYVASSKKPHFMQTAAWGEVNEARGAKSHNLILKDNDRIIGSAMLLEKKVLNYSTFYCPRGFICDYSNLDDIKVLVDALKKYVLDHNGLYLKIDPDIIIRKLNNDLSVLEEFKDNLALIDYLKSLGGKHRGFVKKLSESSAPRFTFRVNLEQDDLLSSFQPRLRNLLKRNNPYDLDISIQSDIDLFYEPMKETSIRKNMYVESKSFFENFYKILNKYDMSDLYVIKANIADLKNKYQSMIDEVNITLSKTQKQGKIDDLNKQLARYNKELALINEIKKDEIILSSVITAKFKDKVWIIHSGNATDLPFLKANYEMYWQIIKDSKAQGYKYTDLYGTEGEIDKSSDAYGIFEYKTKFNGDFDEFIGEFDFITKPLAYNIITKLLIVRRRIKYHLQKLKNR